MVKPVVKTLLRPRVDLFYLEENVSLEANLVEEVHKNLFGIEKDF